MPAGIPEGGSAVARCRERVASDLNDNVIQQLFGVGLDLRRLAGLADGPAQRRIESSIESIDAVIKEIRVTAFALEVPTSRAHGTFGSTAGGLGLR